MLAYIIEVMNRSAWRLGLDADTTDATNKTYSTFHCLVLSMIAKPVFVYSRLPEGGATITKIS